MRLLLAALLGLGCARAATAPVDDGPGGSSGRDGAVLAPDGRAPDLAPGATPDAARPVDQAGLPEDPGFIPPSLRDGGIPRTPPGAPPCAADSNAGNGNACPYKAIVECAVVAEAGPVQRCICLAPPLGGKWSCEPARDAGGPHN